MTDLHSDSVRPVYRYTRFVYDDGCLCAQCQRVRQLERRLARLVCLSIRLVGARKARCWALARRVRTARDEAMEKALRRHKHA